MLKNLFVVTLLLLSGCILYWEPGEPSGRPDSTSETSHSDHETNEIWIENVYIDCEYDYYWDESRWYIDVDIAASYVYFDSELGVDLYIDDYGYWSMNSVGYGMWTQVIDSYYYHCDDYHVFDIVAFDIYGSYDEVTVWW